jgi:hypothetical protein
MFVLLTYRYYNLGGDLNANESLLSPDTMFKELFKDQKIEIQEFITLSVHSRRHQIT